MTLLRRAARFFAEPLVITRCRSEISLKFLDLKLPIYLLTDTVEYRTCHLVLCEQMASAYAVKLL